MARQVAWLTSERLLKMALDRPDFKNVKQFASPEPWKDFSENLKVIQVKNTDQITVTYTDLDPAVAPLAVKAVIRTYNDHFKLNDLDFVKRKADYWDGIRDEADRQIKVARKQISECIAESGWGTDDLSILIKTQQEEQIRFTRQAMMLKQRLEILKNGKAPELSVEDIGRMDTTMASKLQRREQVKTDLARLSLTLLPEHRNIITLKKELLA